MAKADKKKQAEEPAPQAPPPTFEDSIRRLGAIVEQLEDGELPLEESLKLFEEGVVLARTSQGFLESAEQRVEELLSYDEQGRPVTRELSPEDDE